MESLNSPDCHLPAVLKDLRQQNFELVKKIENHLTSTLEQYLKSIIPNSVTNKNRYYRLLVMAMERYLEKHNDPASDIIENLLDISPVIQQADHSNLLLDEETFMNNLLHMIACSLNGISHIISSQCSTVSCITRRHPYTGPTFLRIAGKQIRLTNISNRLLENSNFCTLPNPFHFVINGDYQIFNSKEMLPFLKEIDRKIFKNAESAFRYVNNYIWNNIPYTSNVKRVAFDESMVSELAALHIEQKEGVFYRLLFDKKLRDTYIRKKNEYIRAKNNKVINLTYPDFFWLKKKTKLRALSYKTNEKLPSFTIAETNEEANILFTPDALARELRNKNIYVDRMMAYLLRCLLPNVVAIGGTSQQDYLLGYQQIFLDTHSEVPFLDQDCLEQFNNSSMSRFGGYPLIKMGSQASFPLNEFGQLNNIDTFVSTNINRKLIQTIGDFSCASYLLNRT